MSTYIPNTKKTRLEMLNITGYKDFDDLFSCIPEDLKLKGELSLPSGMNEMQVSDVMEQIASKNKVFKHIFRGAGSYNHYIPAIVKSVISKEEFITAYTPYQAEISQGVLQNIFEYQTGICELTGMDVSNASVYDGGTAAAEAINMCRSRKKSKALISSLINPHVKNVINTYAFGNDTPVSEISDDKGITDIAGLKKALDEDDSISCVVIQHPNFYGNLEDIEKIAELTHEYGAKLITIINPMTLGVLKSPGECGADIAVGEAQPLGLPMGCGGPYIGFMACKEAQMRSLPGRIVGETTDDKGNKSYVLTLQAREQHIRREKAGSNICSNEALCALTVNVYLASVGASGLEKAALLSMSKAHYLADKLKKAGFNQEFDRDFFNEFVSFTPMDAYTLNKALADKGILGGLVLDEKRILWCTTEKNTKEEIDMLVSELEGIIKKGGQA